MKIETHHIASSGSTLVYKKDPGYFAILNDLKKSGECRFSAPIDIQLTVLPVRDFYKVQGHVATTVGLVCSRCLADIDQPLNHNFKLNYSREIPEQLHGDDPGGVELTAEQIGVIFFQGDEIDFRDAVQEQLMLAVPYKPLCKENCKGLCAQCGFDLNNGVCQCDTQRVNGPFEVLKDLKLPDR